MKVNKLKREIDEFFENSKVTKQACIDMLHQVRADLEDLEVEVIEKVIEKEVVKEVAPKKKEVKKASNAKPGIWF